MIWRNLLLKNENFWVSYFFLISFLKGSKYNFISSKETVLQYFLL